MATAELIELADAVKDDFTAHNFCMPLDVRRVFVLPVKKEAERNRVECYITPRTINRTRESRSKWQRDLVVDVALMTNLNDDSSGISNDRAEKCLLLSEEVAAFYEQRIVGDGRWFLVSVEAVVQWDREQFDRFNHFASAHAFTFRGYS